MKQILVLLALLFTFVCKNSVLAGTEAQPIQCGEGACTIINTYYYSPTTTSTATTDSYFDCDGYHNPSLVSVYGVRAFLHYHVWKWQENSSCTTVNGTSTCWILVSSGTPRFNSDAALALYQKYNLGDSTYNPNTQYPNGCANNSCSLKSGEVNYDLKQFDTPDQAPVDGNVCYEDCKQSAEVQWSDCLAGSCVASVKYTYTGDSCGVETSVDDLQTEEPTRCTDQINEKIAQCGGSLKVLSFDFESCTGECTPDACGDQWTELVNRCGGIMAVSSWNAETCSGSCASDPVPDPEDSETEAIPEDVTNETVTNSDGTSEVTSKSTYDVDGVEYTTTTVTYYDANGNKTGTKKTTSKSSSTSKTETFTAVTDSTSFTTPYAPSSEPYDIPTRFNTFLTTVKSSSLFSFSTAFFESLPSGGSSVYSIDAGRYGSHTIDLSDTMSIGLSVLKSILMVCFGFLSIRAVIMKR